MESTKNMNAAHDIFMDLHASAEAYNLEFDMWRRMAGMVMADMSMECGWKSLKRDMDFTDFSGYYMEYSDNEVSLWNNGVCEGRVYPEGQGVRIEGFEDFDFSEHVNNGGLIEACGHVCCSEENIRKAKEEMHQGFEVLVGISYHGMTVFGLDNPDIDVKAQINSLYDNVRFTKEASASTAFDSYRDRTFKVGPEPEFPKLEICFYDGRTVYHEDQFDVLNGRSQEQIFIDKTLFEEFKSGMNKLRREFEAIVAPDYKNFMFENAVFPTSFIRDDAVFLCKKTGTASLGYFSAINGRIGFYEDMSFFQRHDRHKKLYNSVSEALADAREKIFSDKNISIAKKEYMVYCMSHGSEHQLKR